MTDKQIQNWREVLVGMLGPYALLMPKEQVIALRDKMQAQADALGDSLDTQG
jgi:hypothetical protein